MSSTQESTVRVEGIDGQVHRIRLSVAVNMAQMALNADKVSVDFHNKDVVWTKYVDRVNQGYTMFPLDPAAMSRLELNWMVFNALYGTVR